MAISGMASRFFWASPAVAHVIDTSPAASATTESRIAELSQAPRLLETRIPDVALELVDAVGARGMVLVPDASKLLDAAGYVEILMRHAVVAGAAVSPGKARKKCPMT
jgi:hypothetical protein